ncbi:Hexokinase-1 [Lachnellula suecica]|uniref:Phosphotransferase n=1 Tax=Lachnellula suecica TaxID=602035 RepID=A0A8T9BZ16_9HELO|nr:Hexokinase-1 [Lachnellula suecica]
MSPSLSQPIIAAMLKVRQAFYAAIIRSLLRTKSVLQTILQLWIAPSVIKEDVDDELHGRKSMYEEFLKGVEREFAESKEKARLVKLSEGLRKQFGGSLQDSTLNMLPSYNHQLPSGSECGTYLALDVGGSTFRIALIELLGRKSEGAQVEGSRILKKQAYKITSAVRQLKGVEFFDWMAQRIGETLKDQDEGHDMSSDPLSMGMSWSFPIEQTSLRSGLLLGMGKGFLAAHGLLGKDLGDLIQDSCSRRGLNVQLNAIVNDSSATLLSKAYLDQTTRFALILGTGVNAAVHLPVHIFSPPKFGKRPETWHDAAKHVIVNTELSMFGGGILPYTKWDLQLRAAHTMPDFQPMEHFVSGGYLGEIVRLVLVDGILNAGLFGGVVPASLEGRYTLDTETVSDIASDESPSLTASRALFTSRHPSSTTPSLSDMRALRLIASHVTYRASGVAPPAPTPSGPYAALPRTSRLWSASIRWWQNYPGFRESCQEQLDGLCVDSGGAKGVVELEFAEESSLLGAAVAVACLDG